MILIKFLTISKNISSRIRDERAVALVARSSKNEKEKEKKKNSVLLPRKKQTQSSGFETVGIRQGSDITRVEITRGERKERREGRCRSFSSSFFFHLAGKR